jgi:hypothetical protein
VKDNGCAVAFILVVASVVLVLTLVGWLVLRALETIRMPI